jgi:hypothetical protein
MGSRLLPDNDTLLFTDHSGARTWDDAASDPSARRGSAWRSMPALEVTGAPVPPVQGVECIDGQHFYRQNAGYVRT